MSTRYLPRRQLTRHTDFFTDHANRPAYALWGDFSDDPTPPSFSFQVYTTADTSLMARWPAELFTEDAGAWRIDVYERQSDVWACVEHQRRERQWRMNHAGGGPGRIVERYGREAVMNAFIVVIDRERWYWRSAEDDGTTGGPLGVWFDVREVKRRGIVSGGTDVDGMVFEQVEMHVKRMATAKDPNHDLNDVWLRSGMCEWEDTAAPRVPPEAEPEPGTESQPPPPAQLADAHVTITDTPSGSIILQTDTSDHNPALIYTIYPLFATAAPLTPADRTSIARRFTTHLLTYLPSQSIRLDITPQLSLRECIAYATADANVGYSSPYGRRFPECGYSAGTARMQEKPNENARFLVVLDREEWEREGVCFVWAVSRGQGEPEVLVGRVGGGISGVAGRLGGRR